MRGGCLAPTSNVAEALLHRLPTRGQAVREGRREAEYVAIYSTQRMALRRCIIQTPQDGRRAP
jgi:hypothetical protein